jgi:hypothetical protein
MQRGNQSPHLGELVIGVGRLAARNELEHLATLGVPAKWTRRPREADLVQVPEKCLHGRCPVSRRPSDSLADPQHLSQPAARTLTARARLAPIHAPTLSTRPT